MRNIISKFFFSLLALTLAVGQAWATDESISWAITTNTLNLTPTITPATDAHLSNASSTISLTGFSQTSSSKTGYAKPFYNTVADFDASNKFASVSFEVEDDFTFTPASLDMTVFSYGSGNYKYKVIISDTEGNSLTSNEIQPSSGGEAAINFDDISEVTFEGTVTIKLYAYNYNSNSSGKRIYIKSPIAISGSVNAKGGGGDPVCPSGLTISSKNDQVSFTEGEKIELSAALSAGNGTITYQWYKGSVAPANAISGATNAKYEVNSCTTADDGDYFCVASKTSCSDAVNASAFTISVAADTKCFTMPAITSKPANLASVAVTGGTLSDVSTAKSVAMNAAGLKLDGNNVYLKVTLTGASIVTGTKITVAWKNAGSGAGIALVNENLEEKVIDETSVSTEGSASHTFTAAEAANYADEFIIHRNASGTGIYVNAITVEDCGPAIVKHTVTLEYADGATADGSLLVADGKTASQPADPTWEHHRFAGWYNGASPYDWASTVSGDLTLTAHWTQLYTITYAAGDGTATGDAPTQADKAEGETFTVAANTFVVAGKDFEKWNDGTNDYLPDATYTVGTENVTLTAQWKAEADKYTVIFKDGETTLDTKLVEVGSNPSDAGVDKTKALNIFAAWQKDDADIALDDAFWATVVKDATVTLNARWTKAYATSYDMEAYAVSDGATLATLLENLTAANYAYNNVNGIDYGHTHNYIYDGMKYKTNNGDLSFNVNAGKLVIVKTGYLPANDALTMYINGVADPTVFTSAVEATETHKNNYFYSAVEALYRLEILASKGTCAIKAVTITNPFEVSFDVNGGDAPIASIPGTPSVTLPTPTKGTDSFLGWFDALDNKIGDGGASYTPTADIELVAHWESISTDARLASITFSSDAGTLSPAFNPEVVNYTYTMPYGTAAVPTITGATAVNANAKAPVIDAQAAAWGDVAQIHGVAESDDTKDYYITMKIAPKDGACLVWADIPSNNTITYNATNSKYFAESDVTLATTVNGKDGAAPSGVKFQNNNYIHIGGAFLAGDVLALDVTYGTANKMYVYKAQTATIDDVIGELDGTTTPTGVAQVTITEDATDLWLVRGGISGSWNPHVDYVAVYRIMNPTLTAMTINGEAGVIDESLKTVTVELQPGYDLAALTIVPTIVSNTDEALVVKTVTSNEGNWVLGPNTYRLTDKDGDYTEYTITLSVGEVKHTVTFDAQGGTAVDPQQVVDGGNPVVPTAPTKDDYIFQGWAETADGAVVDVTTFTINAPKTFYAIWASDGAIKLLDGSTVNHTNFITGVTADETVEFMGNTVNYAKFSGTVSGVNGVKDLTRVIAYNATTTQTKIQISAHNNSTNARSILVKGVVEGSTDVTDIATVALGNKEDKVTEYYEFNNDVANRTIYIIVPNSAGDVFFTQVKVIESGAALPMAGQAGYALNLNKGRVFGLGSGDPIAFEGLNIEQLESDYQPTSSNPLKLYPNKSISFTVTSNVLLSLNSTSNKIYYVTKDAAGTDNPTEKTGVSEFALTAGTWYVTAGAEKLQLTNIAFSAPKCAEPSFASLTNSDICAGDPYVALDGTATVADAGVPTYQWYNADGDAAIDGATSATYTPTADGSYYVIATNHLAGFADNAKQSATVTVTTFASANITSAPLNQRGTAGDDATLTVAATGKNLSYQWFTCDNEAGENPTVMAGEENASLTVTIPSGTQWYKVVVSSDCGNVEATAKVEEFIPATPQNVTESTTWDWKSTTAGFPTENSSIDFANTSVEELLANVSSLMPNNDAFHSDMLYGIGQRAWRKSNNDGECGFQGFQLRFHTEVAGRVRVYFRAPSSGQTSVVRINGNEAGSRGNSWGWSQYIYVDANSDVVIAMTNGETGMTRVQKMEFQTPDYTRTAMLGNGVLGTLCVDHNVPVEGIQGATFYELAGKDNIGKIAFDEITTGELEAGVPYVFQAHGDNLALYYGSETEAAPVDKHNGMYGTFSDITLTELDDVYYFAQKALWSCTDLTSLSIPANRAYVKLSEIPSAMAPAPGRIRMTLNVNGAPAVTTGMEEITNDQSQMTNKVIIDGRLFILRGEKLYDATGRLVK